MNNSFVKNKKILITAGPTREWMDPVRFLSNPSSGIMGLEVAETLRKKGARVTLVLGPTLLSPSKKIKTIPVSTAVQMLAAVRKNLSKADAFIATAAVGDWRFATTSSRKIKKTAKNSMTVRLVKNPDILAFASRRKKRDALLVGFALETENELANAFKKLRAKNLDLIVVNRPDSFADGAITASFVDRDREVKKYPRMSKKALSQKIAEWLGKQWDRTK